MRLCPLRRAECAQRHAYDAPNSQEPCAGPRRWQSSVSSLLSTSPHTPYSPQSNRPEQLILQDDPSFLPEFALPPLELLADLDHDFNFTTNRSGESQSLTPFGSQSLSHAAPLGGLILPTSSPDRPAEFHIEGDNELAGQSGLLGADEGFQLNEPEFTFDENGEFVENVLDKGGLGTPAVGAMQSDAGASAKVRREHEEGRVGAGEVSFTPVFCALLHFAFTCLSRRQFELRVVWPHLLRWHGLTCCLTCVIEGSQHAVSRLFFP